MPKAVRHDPKHRDIDPELKWVAHGALKNRDPERHYLLANAAGAEFGVDYWEALGYKVEAYVEGGPHYGRNQKPGQPVTLRDQVLMSCPMAAFLERERHGEQGGTGQALHDKIEARLLELDKGPFDPMRGTRQRFGNRSGLRLEDDGSSSGYERI